MEHVADGWPARSPSTRPTARALTALAVSVLCHATVLLLVRGWRLEDRVSPPLVVTMVERGGGDGARPGGAPSEAAVAAPPTSVAPPAVVPPPHPAAPRAVARREVPRAAPRVATAAIAPHARAVDAPPTAE